MRTRRKKERKNTFYSPWWHWETSDIFLDLRTKWPLTSVASKKFLITFFIFPSFITFVCCLHFKSSTLKIEIKEHVFNKPHWMIGWMGFSSKFGLFYFQSKPINIIIQSPLEQIAGGRLQRRFALIGAWGEVGPTYNFQLSFFFNFRFLSWSKNVF